MSVFVPAKKRIETKASVTRTTRELSLPRSHSQEEVRDPPTTSSTPLQEGVRKRAPRDPRGWKTFVRSTVWNGMVKNNFVQIGDALPWSDVWTQPLEIQGVKTTDYVDVVCRQIILAPIIFSREVVYKISCEELLALLYLSDKLKGDATAGFDEWVEVKTQKYINAHGSEFSESHAHLCDFILREDTSFSFDEIVNGKLMLSCFFRKVCVHNYPDGEVPIDDTQFNNPAMIKYQAKTGQFEYLYQAQLIPFDYEWIRTNLDKRAAQEEVPESQPF